MKRPWSLPREIDFETPPSSDLSLPSRPSGNKRSIEKTWCRGAELNCGHADFQSEPDLQRFPIRNQSPISQSLTYHKLDFIRFCWVILGSDRCSLATVTADPKERLLYRSHAGNPWKCVAHNVGYQIQNRSSAQSSSHLNCATMKITVPPTRDDLKKSILLLISTFLPVNLSQQLKHE